MYQCNCYSNEKIDISNLLVYLPLPVSAFQMYLSTLRFRETGRVFVRGLNLCVELPPNQQASGYSPRRYWAGQLKI